MKDHYYAINGFLDQISKGRMTISILD